MAALIVPIAFAIIAGLGLAAYIRLAPSDPAVWHIDPTTRPPLAPIGAGPQAGLVVYAGGASFQGSYPDRPADLLQRLDAIAMATARTTRLAGDAASGRITWITRSRFWGFPDYTTADARPNAGGSQLQLYARLRFGRGDLGVNAARLSDWLSHL